MSHYPHGLALLYRQFWSEFVQTGNEAYNEFYDDPFVQAYVLYTFSSVFHRINPAQGGTFLDEEEYRSHVVPVLEKNPHLLHPFAVTEVEFARHLTELSFRGSFQVDVDGVGKSGGPGAWKFLNNICSGLQINTPYFQGTLSYYLGLHRQCLQELGITTRSSRSKKVQAYEQAARDFATFDGNIADDVDARVRYIWRRPSVKDLEKINLQKDEIEIFEELPDLARSAHYGSFHKREKHTFPFDLRNYDVYLGDVLIRAYKQIENLREWTGLPFDWKTFGPLQRLMEEKFPKMKHPRLWL